MPKLKTNKTAVKRVSRISGTGKISHRKTLAQHLVRRKSKRTVKSSGRVTEFTPADSKKIKKLIGR
jgi:large subunit ribosomal protein L35